jgi:DNA-binding NtrC family response regulator
MNELEKLIGDDDGKPRVFFVDDEPDLLELYAMALEEDAIVETFRSPVEFLNDYKAGKHKEPHVLVSDLMMPNISGLQLLSSLREETDIACPFVLLSGHLSKDNLIKAVDIGVEKVLEKPCELSEIRDTVFDVFYRSEIKSIRAAVRLTARKIVELTATFESLASDAMPGLKHLMDNGYVSDSPDAEGITFRQELLNLNNQLNSLLEQERLLDKFSKLTP